ncbi:MAG: TIM barrel protein [Pirellulaceae bacterium]
MIKSAVTISLVPEARGGPFVFWDDLPGSVRKARQLGFDAVEIFPPGPDALKVSDVKNLLGDHGLSLAAVGTGAGWVKHKLRLTDGDAAVRQKARDFVKSMIDFAGALGAPAIVGSMQGRHGEGVTRDAALGYLAEAVTDLGSHARQHGVPLIYEPINRYETNLITSIVEGAAFLRPLGDSNVLLLADLFHMNIEEVDLPAAIRAAKGFIGHVHFVDSNRRPAGLGHMDYAPIAAALRETGYDRYCSAEALPYPDSDAAAEQTINTFKKYFPR